MQVLLIYFELFTSYILFARINFGVGLVLLDAGMIIYGVIFTLKSWSILGLKKLLELERKP